MESPAGIATLPGRTTEVDASYALSPTQRGSEPSAFRLYFSDLSTTRRLSPKEELATALELRRHRRTLWEALLGEPSLQPQVFAAIARVLPTVLMPAPGTSDAAFVALLAEADRDLCAASAALQVVRDHAEPGTLPRERCEDAFATLKRARDAFVTANLPLVVSVARRYTRRGLNYLDAVQEGNAGLLKAVDRFDPQRGVRFSTYAVWWIRHSIGRAIADRGTEIRVPAHLVERRQLLARTRAAFEREHGRAPTPSELAEILGLSHRKVERALGAVWERATSHDARDGGVAPLDVEGLPATSDTPDRYIDGDRVEDALRELIETLPRMQKEVLRRRFGFDGGSPKTLREIGEMFGLSRERIRQLQNRALLTLRRSLRERGVGHEILLCD